MVLSKENLDVQEEIKLTDLTSGQKRRLRRKKLQAARAASLPAASLQNGVHYIASAPVAIDTGPNNYIAKYKAQSEDLSMGKTLEIQEPSKHLNTSCKDLKKENMPPTEPTKKTGATTSPSKKSTTSTSTIRKGAPPAIVKKDNKPNVACTKKENELTKSSKTGTKPTTPRYEETCPLLKRLKTSKSSEKEVEPVRVKENVQLVEQPKVLPTVEKSITDSVPPAEPIDKSKDDIKAAREAKKLAKQKTKKKTDTLNGNEEKKASPKPQAAQVSQEKEITTTAINKPPTVVKTTEAAGNKINSSQPTESKLPNKTKSDNEITAQVDKSKRSKEQTNVESSEKKAEEGKSKAELKAERRAKQEAQRAAKQAAQQLAQPAGQQKVAKTPAKSDAKLAPAKAKEVKSPRTKTLQKPKSKVQTASKDSWLHYLLTKKKKEPLQNIPINSNLHPAVIKLGVQLASGVITDSNARCIALLDAIKKMVRDFSLPARTEFARGLQAQLAASAAHLAAARAPHASETNALKHVRKHLTLLPNNVDEFDAKKTLQEEIDKYIREQIDMAGEAICLAVQKKICNGDTILTYGGSSLVERVLVSAWASGRRFRALVAGARCGPASAARGLLRRLLASGLHVTYVDVSALGAVMPHVQKVLLGAESVCGGGGGAAVCAAGSAALAQLARARNVPVLVACETHKFTDHPHTEAFIYNDIGDPDELIDESDENSPLKDWRSIPNLSLLNLAYDVTPPDLISALVTELAILPCTSAPVVLRFKLSEYGI